LEEQPTMMDSTVSFAISSINEQSEFIYKEETDDQDVQEQVQLTQVIFIL